MHKEENTANGLNLVTDIQSEITDHGSIALEELKETGALIQNKLSINSGFGVFYLDYGVRFAQIKNGTLKFWPDDFDAEFLQLARIFNEDCELKIWENHDHFRYRVRVDGQGGPCEYVKAEQILWGTKFETLESGWIRSCEDRGTEVILPPFSTADPGSFKRIALTTHHYITYLEHHQASYSDCRFSGFILKQ